MAGQNSVHNDKPSLSADLVIIGGGISGTLAASVLARSGHKVCLIDRHDTYPPDFRAEHLDDVKIPMLFLQGTRDELADSTLLTAVAKRLGKRATLQLYEDGDHSFHVRARSGHTDAEVFEAMMNDLAAWADNISAT